MKNPKIFILDGNAPRRNMLMYRLRGGEFRNVTAFSSEKECLYRITENGAPAVLITDTGPDASSSFSLLSQVRQAAPSVHVVFYTDTDDEQLAGMLLAAGATDYILRTPNSEAGIRELSRNIRYLIRQETPSSRYM